MRLLLERVRQAGASNSRVVVAIILFVLGILTVLLGTRTASSAPPNSLVSAGFNNSNQPGSYSGVEPLAQSANSAAFGSANYWNPLTLGYLSPETNPSFSFLKDSGGNLTTVGLQFTGSVDSYTAGGSNDHGIFGDFIYLNGGSLPWKLTGLVPNTVAYLYFYGYGSNFNSQSYRTFNMALDTTGGGSLNGNFTVDYYTGVYAGSVQVSPTGTISGAMQFTNGQASWSGFKSSARCNKQAQPAPPRLPGWSVGGRPKAMPMTS